MRVIYAHPSVQSLPRHRRAIWGIGNSLYELGRRMIDNRYNMNRLTRAGERVAIAGVALRMVANHGILYWFGRQGLRCLYVSKTPRNRADGGQS